MGRPLAAGKSTAATRAQHARQSINRAIDRSKQSKSTEPGLSEKKKENERRRPPGRASLARSHRWNTRTYPPSNAGGMGGIKRIWVLAADLMEFETGRDCVIGIRSLRSAWLEIIVRGLSCPNVRESEGVGGRGASEEAMDLPLGIVQASSSESDSIGRGIGGCKQLAEQKVIKPLLRTQRTTSLKKKMAISLFFVRLTPFVCVFIYMSTHYHTLQTLSVQSQIRAAPAWRCRPGACSPTGPRKNCNSP